MIRFGIVGTGRISDWVLKGAIQDRRFKAVAVCSRSEDAAIAFISSHPEVFDKDTKVFTSIEKMAECPEVDAVYIGTPNKTHKDYTLACLNRGKHVLCEKPLACNSAEVEEMIQASRRNGKALMEAMIATLNPNFRAARAKLPEIGVIRQYFSSYCQYSTKYEALKQGIVANSFNPQMGGGALEDIGIYTTYPLAVLFGKPQSISSCISTIKTDCGEVNTQGMVLLGYEGMTANLSYSKAVDAHTATEFCAEGGSIILDNIHNCIKAEFIPYSAPSGGRNPIKPRETIREGLEMDSYFYEFEEFLNVIDRGGIESEINSHEASLVNRQIMDEINKSVK